MTTPAFSLQVEPVPFMPGWLNLHTTLEEDGWTVRDTPALARLRVRILAHSNALLHQSGVLEAVPLQDVVAEHLRRWVKDGLLWRAARWV